MICSSGNTPTTAGCDEQSARCACRRGCDETHRRWYGWRLGAYLVAAAEEQVDEQPADMVAAARASDARQSK